MTAAVKVHASSVEMIPVGALKGYDRNARTHPEEQIEALVAIIADSGFTNPLLIDEACTIIAGHGRLEAAQRLGMDALPCIRVGGLSDDQIRALRVSDNAVGLRSGWDEDLLRAELDALAVNSFDLDMLGFAADDLDALLNPASTSTADPDDTPPVPTNPVTKLGDVWLLGGHRLLCGDSTSANAVTALMAGKLADICFTSPPYGQQRDYGVAKDQIADWDALMRGVFAVLPMKTGAQVLVNLGMVHRDSEWLPYWDGWIAWMREQGWRRFGWYVWDQGPGLPGDWNGRLAPSHEFIFHFNREPRRANKSVPSKMAGKISNGGLRNRDGSIGGRAKGASAIQSHKIADSVFRVTRHKGGLGDAGSHPAIFPVNLPGEVLDAYAKKGALAFEPFCGSGSQIIAAEQRGVMCRAMELDPAYVDVAVRRWEAFTGRDATLEATGQTFAEVTKGRAA